MANPPDDTYKKYRVYKGVIIYREYVQIAGSNQKELKDGTLKDCKPQYEVYYVYAGSYRYDTIPEVIASINEIRRKSELDEEEFAQLMNDWEK